MNLSDVKVFSASLALEVGVKAAVLLQHLKYWMEKKKVDVLYHTNEQWLNDLPFFKNISAIQRAKKVLVDAGYIEIVKKGFDRTCRFLLTEKSKKMFGMFVKADVGSSVVVDKETQETKDKLDRNEKHFIDNDKGVFELERNCNQTHDALKHYPKLSDHDKNTLRKNEPEEIIKAKQQGKTVIKISDDDVYCNGSWYVRMINDVWYYGYAVYNYKSQKENVMFSLDRISTDHYNKNYV